MQITFIIVYLRYKIKSMAYSKASHFEDEDIQLAKLAKALAHPARIAILKQLAKRNTCICNDLVEILPLSQSTTSQHLKELKEVELIDGEIDGPRVCYCLNMDTCRKTLQQLNRLFREIKCC